MQAGTLFLIGATHRTATIGLRERFSLSAANEAALAEELSAMPALREFLILNTCNRMEIYGVASDASARFAVVEAFCRRQGVDRAQFEQIQLDLLDQEVIAHLLSVVCGLDSQMLGENEIFGQVKRAFASAQARHSAGAVLNRLFQKAFQAAKLVRANTAITSGLVSVANVAVEYAHKVFGDLRSAKVLLLGAGEIGLKSGRAFRSRGHGGLTVASRRLEHAVEVAAELGAEALEFTRALERVGEFDIVVCSTSAPGTISSAELAKKAAAARGGRPLLFIDVALPRDVEAGVGALENIFSCDLDDLARVAAENRSARQAEIVKCEAILQERGAQLWAQLERSENGLGRVPADGGARKEIAVTC